MEMISGTSERAQEEMSRTRRELTSEGRVERSMRSSSRTCAQPDRIRWVVPLGTLRFSTSCPFASSTILPLPDSARCTACPSISLLILSSPPFGVSKLIRPKPRACSCIACCCCCCCSWPILAVLDSEIEYCCEAAESGGEDVVGDRLLSVPISPFESSISSSSLSSSYRFPAPFAPAVESMLLLLLSAASFSFVDAVEMNESVVLLEVADSAYENRASPSACPLLCWSGA